MSGLLPASFAILFNIIVPIDDFVFTEGRVIDHSGRKLVRKNKRLKVKFVTDKSTRLAFAGNVSAGGVHVVTHMPEHPGSSVTLFLQLPDGQEVIVSGIVCWAKKVPGNLMRLTKFAGMGVKFTRFESGRSAYEEFLEGLRY